MKCCVLFCKNYSDRRSEAMDGITFHVFPSDDNLRQKWVAKINRADWTPTKHTKICSAHFNEEDFKITKKGLRKLKEGALPCLRLDLSINRQLPEPCSSNVSGYVIFYDSPREKKLAQEIAPLQSNVQIDALNIRRHQTSNFQVNTLKKKNAPHSNVESSRNEDSMEGEEGAPLSHYTSSAESMSGTMRYSSEAVAAQEAVRAHTSSSAGPLQQEILMDLHQLSDKIQNTFQPLRGRQFTFTFKGADGDECEYIFMSTSTKRGRAARHRGVSCNECGDVIRGRRYACVSCVDYDVCEACETLGVHEHHLLVRITTPITAKRAQDLLRRWKEALKTAGADSVEAFVTPPPPCTDTAPTAQQISSGNPDENDASRMDTTEEESVTIRATPNRSPTPKRQKKCTKKTAGPRVKLEKSESPKKTKSKLREDQHSGTEPSKPRDTKDSDDTAESNDSVADAEKSDRGFDEKSREAINVTVKLEPDSESMVQYLTSFDESEVMLDEVKVEYPDPLDPDNQSGSASAAGRGGLKRPKKSSAQDSLCETYVHRKLDY